MPKLFCVSDIHGFFDEMKSALDAAGFDPKNENHWLIVCGDCFDRGLQTWNVFNYLNELPRKIIIRGNHEDLLLECVERGYPLSHDVTNGTAQTVMDFGDSNEFKRSCKMCGKVVGEFIKNMPYYFETEKYVFVHGWLPPMLDEFGRTICTVHPQWYHATDAEWAKGAWRNGMAMYFKKEVIDKTVVCGHWHTSYGHFTAGHCKEEYGEDAIFEPFIAEGIIAIDGCIARTKKCNVVVLEDEFLDDFIEKGAFLYESKE